ncbi:hypothetical protein ACSBR2_004435 [Camellia fascicularis]
MEKERQRDLRVPLISGLFFVTCLTGGILLFMWLLDVQGSQHWFPIVALVLISFPWIFWFLTYIYTLIKVCFRRSGGGGGGGGGGGTISRRESSQSKLESASTNKMNRTLSSGKGQVEVVLDDGHNDGADEASVTSSKECEMPLTQSVSS